MDLNVPVSQHVHKVKLKPKYTKTKIISHSLLQKTRFDNSKKFCPLLGKKMKLLTMPCTAGMLVRVEFCYITTVLTDIANWKHTDHLYSFKMKKLTKTFVLSLCFSQIKSAGPTMILYEITQG